MTLAISVELTVRVDPAVLAVLADIARALTTPAAKPKPISATKIDPALLQDFGVANAPAAPPLVAADTPPAAPPPPAARPNTVWTDERKALLSRLYPQNVSRDDILARVNALPGQAIVDVERVSIQASVMHLKRGDGPMPTPTIAQPLEVTYGTAFKWAGERGLASIREGMDLEKVNRKRVELGQVPFKIVPQQPVQRPAPAQ